MSRKDYVAAAEIIRRQPLTNMEKAGIAADFADLFGKDNPRFDKRRFMDACGVQPEPEVCGACGAVEGTPEYDNWHDSENCWAKDKTPEHPVDPIEFDLHAQGC